MEWTTAASLAARITTTAYANRNFLSKHWTKLKAYFNWGATEIVVTGIPGAGKTQLVSQMDGRARDLVYEVPGESRLVEVDAVTIGKITRLVRVLPGQKAFRIKGEIEAFQGNKKLQGVIHVVDYGFSVPRNEAIVSSLIEVDGVDTIDKLRGRNLRLEIESLQLLLADVTKLITTNNKPKWIIIAVNKIDLYLEDVGGALRYYSPEGDGEFGRILADFQRQIGSHNIGLYIVKCCAHESDFSWNNSKINSSLPRQMQGALLREFVETLAAVLEVHK